jgi:hypothetical protein
MPMSLEYSSGSIRWPLFLLAKKVCRSIIAAPQPPWPRRNTLFFFKLPLKLADYLFLKTCWQLRESTVYFTVGESYYKTDSSKYNIV